jgi:hypothetical protein
MANPERTIKGLLSLVAVLWLAFFGATAVSIIFAGPERPEVVDVLFGEEPAEAEEPPEEAEEDPEEAEEPEEELEEEPEGTETS